ncbi:MAG: hypothetical protein OXU61_07180, partial [Gammaproteobacteria bacterium]|nr:hypothetical protein [Gammaproteobacteria bacterium]
SGGRPSLTRSAKRALSMRDSGFRRNDEVKGRNDEVRGGNGGVKGGNGEVGIFSPRRTLLLWAYSPAAGSGVALRVLLE